MKKYLYNAGAIALLALITLSGCSDQDGTTDNTEPAQTAQQPAQTTAPAPSTTPAQSKPATKPAGNLPTNGKVVKAMHAGGYTYMQLEKDGRQFWIAATMMNVKRNQYVTWADAAVMKNFKSSTLRRTFDEILFVSNASIEQ